MIERSAYRVLVLIPSGQGGIRRLFEVLESHGRNALLDWHEFPTTEEGKLKLPSFVRILFRFHRHLAEQSYDLVHINLASSGSAYRKLVFAFACERKQIPYVIHLHGGRFESFFANSPRLLQKRIRRMFRKAAGVITLGSYWRDYILDEFALPPNRVAEVPNAVYAPLELSSKVRNAPAPALKLLFLGKLSANKGVPQLLEALSAPELADLPWTATLAGNGDVDYFRSEVARLGLGLKVSLPGWVDSAAVQNLLLESDVIILPSLVENMPLSLLEGMGYGLFPIASNVGAIPEIIRNEQNGLLLRNPSSEAIREAVTRVITEDGLLERGSAQARLDFIQSYDIHEYPTALLDAYSSFNISAANPEQPESRS